MTTPHMPSHAEQLLKRYFATQDAQWSVGLAYIDTLLQHYISSDQPITLQTGGTLQIEHAGYLRLYGWLQGAEALHDALVMAIQQDPAMSAQDILAKLEEFRDVHTDGVGKLHNTLRHGLIGVSQCGKPSEKLQHVLNLFDQAYTALFKLTTAEVLQLPSQEDAEAAADRDPTSSS